VVAVKNMVRWLPAIVAPILVVGGALAIPAVANAASTPPSRTAQQVLALIAGSKDAAYSGTIQQTSALGLPQLPSVGSGSSSTGSDATSQLLDLLTADHTARLFVDGSTKERLQVLDSLAERDAVRNGHDLWTYDSKTKTATHQTLTGHTPAAGSASPDAQTLSPAQLADKFITAIEPSTTVTVNSTASVAGRAVYQLELTPKTDSTLISHVTLSVDAATGLPLKVVVDARGQKSDAFTVGFSSIDFSTPSAALFDFTPPKGATVTTPSAPTKSAPTAGSATQHPKPAVSGTGWSSIIELPAGTAGAAIPSASASQNKLLDELTTSVDGGRALQTSLLSVLMTSDGRVFVGSVPVASLEAAAQ
jgi:outer membrane lipoprotein-sorting protein